MSDSNNKKPRLRFAPSPTGPLTLGNARTALFNWIYARHADGKFLLRIEDTDLERSEKQYEENIIESLRWLGLEWDEEIYRQSERLELYEEYLNQLLEKGYAYWCFCSEEELEEEKQRQREKGTSPTYSGKCREVSLDEARERLENGEEGVVRFKMPKRSVSFNDIIRDKVEFDGAEIGDFVIATAKDRPLYNFAVVVDDHEMNITHVVRGEDHISNTPKQIAIMEALEFSKPKFAHLPLILSSEGGKLSKRFSKGAVAGFKEKGYISEALFNFMAFLGWHPKEDTEVLNKEEVIERFTLDRVQKGGAALDVDKLNWYNGYYIRNIDLDKLVEYMEDFVPEEWLEDEEKLKEALSLERDRMEKLTDFKEKGGFFFELPDYDPDLLVWDDKEESSKDSLESIYNFLEKEGELNIDSLREFMNEVSDKKGGKGEVYWPLRAALSGQEASPGPLEIAEVLGFEETLNRLDSALSKL